MITPNGFFNLTDFRREATGFFTSSGFDSPGSSEIGAGCSGGVLVSGVDLERLFVGPAFFE